MFIKKLSFALLKMSFKKTSVGLLISGALAGLLWYDQIPEIKIHKETGDYGVVEKVWIEEFDWLGQQEFVYKKSTYEELDIVVDSLYDREKLYDCSDGSPPGRLGEGSSRDGDVDYIFFLGIGDIDCDQNPVVKKKCGDCNDKLKEARTRYSM